MNKIKICKVCGREVHKLTLGMCKKHYEQYHKYGKVLDNNPRTVWDDNEIRTYIGEKLWKTTPQIFV